MWYLKSTPRTLAAPLLRTATPSFQGRRFHQTTLLLRPPTTSETQSEHKPTEDEDGDDKHRPGSPKPKISNLSVPGVDTAKHLSEEQREEVRRHNEDFAKKHERGEKAGDDKVDKSFWSGGGTREGPGVTKLNTGGGTKK